ncbi:unnamed protein product [Durusdinium trenchii]|uniref:Uncharacterized protein n=1 Tax=Durusdinium trenchii TaxID=1381693 RepID=A0ABP0IIM3_9DINO
MQAGNKEEFLKDAQRREKQIRREKNSGWVVALREARVTYIAGRPFHGYWRIRQSLKSASAASNHGGYQDFSFPLEDIAPYVAEFASVTGIPVGGVDFIWEEENADVKTMPYTLEAASFYIDMGSSSILWLFAHGVPEKFIDWAEEPIGNIRETRWQGSKKAYTAAEVIQDKPVPGAADALRRLRTDYFIRFLTARGSYEDPFNVTQTWLDLNGFEYDELLVVDGPEAKVHVLLVLLFNMIVRRPCPAFLVEGFILDYLAVTKVQAGRLKPKRIGKLSLLLTGCAPFHPVHTGG